MTSTVPGAGTASRRRLLEPLEFRLSPRLKLRSERLVTTPEVLVEVGPGKVLSGLTKRIAPEVRTLSIGDPEAAVRVDFAAVPQ